jgi:phosphoribosylamine---glycine ligase
MSEKRNILVVGGGGREHALCWKLSQSSLCRKLYCAPGNAGIEGIAECVPVGADNVSGLLTFAREKEIGLTVVGPEVSLTLGLADAFAAEGLAVFGPSAAAARLEGSKVFAKEFMTRAGIPTAEYAVFTSLGDAIEHLNNISYPVVVKADGLAAGKGVAVAQTKDEAIDFVRDVMAERIFGDAGARVLIEDCMVGEELSILAVSDGKNIVVLTPSQDHKRAYDNDEGPNTGGMGAYSPVSLMNDALAARIRDEVLSPAIDGMAREGHPFIGVLYAGLMLTSDGPSVLEFNVRFGDPEAQAVIPIIKGDLGELCLAAAKGDLRGCEPAPSDMSAVCVVMASGGYPGKFEKGKVITGLEEAAKTDAIVFHAGTARRGGDIVTSGGRVLGVTALAGTFGEAREKAYGAVDMIRFDGAHYRRDIGWKEMKRST